MRGSELELSETIIECIKAKIDFGFEDLEMLAKRSGKRGHVDHTPIGVASFIAQMLKHESPKRILDPFAATGGDGWRLETTTNRTPFLPV